MTFIRINLFLLWVTVASLCVKSDAYVAAGFAVVLALAMFVSAVSRDG